MKFTRRKFVAALGAGSASAAAQAPAPPANPKRARGNPPEVPPFEAPLEFARRDVAPKVKPFAMTQVRLVAGLLHDVQEANRGYMSRLPVDRLVRSFRANAGLPTNAKPFGGWEQPDNGRRESELRGHFTGHFLSASAQLYASTGDQEAKAKGDEMVDELAQCQSKLGGGYLSAFPLEFFDRLDARENVWAPFYTIHKNLAGMIDMYQFAGNQKALEVARGLAGWVDQWTASKSEEHMQDILGTEYGGMNEALYNLAALTGDERWAKAGDRFTKKRFFNPLALRRDELRGLHANTHIPQVIGAARRYEISGDNRFHDVADFFWYEIVNARSYVTGGTSNREGWLTNPRRLAAELKRGVDTEECCPSYNMLKLTRHLYQWTADARYFDYYERLLWNARIGTIRPEDGHTQYYFSLTPGAWRTFCTEDNSFWCCTGTGIEEYSKLNDSIYWHDEEGVYVNLFIASELDWAEKGLKLRQETKFPHASSTKVIVGAEKPVASAIRLRIPQWVSGASVKINGKLLEASASPGSYMSLSRTWSEGDRIELNLPMALRLEAMPDDPGEQAFLYGPLVLAGDLGSEGLAPELITGPMAPQLDRASRIDIPRLHGDPLEFLKPGDAPLHFRTSKQSKDVALAPLNSLLGRRYAVYWIVS